MRVRIERASLALAIPAQPFAGPLILHELTEAAPDPVEDQDAGNRQNENDDPRRHDLGHQLGKGDGQPGGLTARRRAQGDGERDHG